MRRLIIASALAAFCLAGCSANKDFEKEILGHPAPESPNNTGWSKAPPPPPPPPPAYAPPPPPAYQPAPPPPRPAVAAKAPVAAPAPVTPPAATPPGGEAPKPKPFTPSPVAPNASAPPAMSEAPAAPAVPAAPAAPAAAAQGERMVFTFQVGAYAHAEKAKELMHSLESRGFATRMEQGKLNNRTFLNVYATKEGNRAELEGELFANGVTEPRLTEERPAGAGSAKKTPASAKVTPAAAPQPAVQKAATSQPASPKAATSQPAAQKTPTPDPAAQQKAAVKYAPPVVEPAPPLPDGYVPPPKKSGS